MRLDAVSKAGFYPTPLELANYIVQVISKKSSRQISILDPCCGDGEWLAKIVENLFDHLNFRTTSYEKILQLFGIELDKDRAEKAKRRLDGVGAFNFFKVNILNTDLFDTIIQPLESFSILYLNPPYDYSPEDKRLEIVFLKHCHKYLQTGGLLIYVVPEYIFENKKCRVYKLGIFRGGNRLFDFRKLVPFQGAVLHA